MKGYPSKHSHPFSWASILTWDTWQTSGTLGRQDGRRASVGLKKMGEKNGQTEKGRHERLLRVNRVKSNSSSNEIQHDHIVHELDEQQSALPWQSANLPVAPCLRWSLSALQALVNPGEKFTLCIRIRCLFVCVYQYDEVM